ncbi:hypothetical protein P167DRAFT_569826 [Morchella conica CCBAS932]|uniref:Uncharacterized protein n=1 Tax=Morchella conica CCBAS932 TaxID=1392247 RepID=A0A3N4L3H1_9PEZI|nr:hypothetical protein P167DRAFT_569826 [Morchella conica CCBAS932]
MGEIKGTIGTMKRQLGVLLAIGLVAAARYFFTFLRSISIDQRTSPPSKTEMQASVQEIRNILEV